MKHLNTNIKLIIVSVMAIVPGLTIAAVPHAFTSGDPIVASEMNDNFNDLDSRATSHDTGFGVHETRLNALDARGNAGEATLIDHEFRIVAIEAGNTGQQGQTVAVDCIADPEALRNLAVQTVAAVDGVDFTFYALPGDKTTYMLTGFCNGPVSLINRRNVELIGARSDKTLDGIRLPGLITVNPFATVGVYTSNVSIHHLTLDALNYVAGSGNPWGSGISNLSVGQGSVVKVHDTDLKGSDWGLDVWKNSYAKTYQNVTITEFNGTGAGATWGAHVELRNAITVTGRVGTTETYPAALGVYNGGTIDFKGGGVVTPATGGSAIQSYAFSAFHGSTIRVRGNAATLQGDIESGANSTARVQDGATITGNVDVYDGSYLRMQNITQSGGYIWTGRNGTLRIDGASTVDVTGFYFSGQLGSSIGIRDSASVTAPAINLDHNATLYYRDTVNLNNSPIDCQSQVNQVGNFGGTPTGVLFGTCP